MLRLDLAYFTIPTLQSRWWYTRTPPPSSRAYSHPFATSQHVASATGFHRSVESLIRPKKFFEYLLHRHHSLMHQPGSLPKPTGTLASPSSDPSIHNSYCRQGVCALAGQNVLHASRRLPGRYALTFGVGFEVRRMGGARKVTQMRGRFLQVNSVVQHYNRLHTLKRQMRTIL